jgi:hypothetical protein
VMNNVLSRINCSSQLLNIHGEKQKDE